MADIRAFKALRFNTKNAGELSKLVCPPYDVISYEQREQYINKNEYNIVNLEMPIGEDAYLQAKELMDLWIDNKILYKEDKEGIYIYEKSFKYKGEEKKIKGIICQVKLEEFSSRVILPHEYTLSKAKNDRLNLMKATYSNFSPIYCLYKDKNKLISNLIDQASNRDEDIIVKNNDQTQDRVWVVNNKPIINNLIKQFINCKLYIADGHHRYETALNFRNWCREKNINNSSNYTMMMLVDFESPGLVVLPTHRIIKGVKGFDGQKLLNICAKNFDIMILDSKYDMEKKMNKMYNQNKICFGLYLGNNDFYILLLKNNDLKNKQDDLRSLDVSILHELILQDILEIDPQSLISQKNLEYTREIKKAIQSVKSNKAQSAFFLNPTRVKEICSIADLDKRMPQKSTYFYPKLTTGIIMNLID